MGSIPIPQGATVDEEVPQSVAIPKGAFIDGDTAKVAPARTAPSYAAATGEPAVARSDEDLTRAIGEVSSARPIFGESAKRGALLDSQPASSSKPRTLAERLIGQQREQRGAPLAIKNVKPYALTPATEQVVPIPENATLSSVAQPGVNVGADEAAKQAQDFAAERFAASAEKGGLPGDVDEYGKPVNPLETGTAAALGLGGYPKMAKVLDPHVTPFEQEHPVRGTLARIQSGLAGEMEAATPAFGAAGVEAAAAGPMALAKFATPLVGGAAAGEVAKRGMEAAKAPPEAAELAKTLAFFLGSTLSLRSSQPGAPVEGAELGVPGASVGVAKTPEAYGVGARVGKTAIGYKVPRSAPAEPAGLIEEGGLNDYTPTATGARPMPPGDPEIISPIQAEAQRQSAENTASMATKDAAEAKASEIARGVPQPPPPVAPQPEPPPMVNDQNAQAVAHVISQLPEEAQPAAIMEAVQTAAASILHHQGAVVDGEVHVASTPEQAQKIAAKIINAQIEQADKLAESPSDASPEKTKETPAEQPQASEVATGAQGSQAEAVVSKPDIFDKVESVPRGTITENSEISKGSRVTLSDGREGEVSYSHPKMSILRVKTDDGENVTTSRQKVKPASAGELPPSVRKTEEVAEKGSVESQAVTPKKGAGEKSPKNPTNTPAGEPNQIIPLKGRYNVELRQDPVSKLYQLLLPEGKPTYGAKVLQPQIRYPAAFHTPEEAVKWAGENQDHLMRQIDDPQMEARRIVAGAYSNNPAERAKAQAKGLGAPPRKLSETTPSPSGVQPKQEVAPQTTADALMAEHDSIKDNPARVVDAIGDPLRARRLFNEQDRRLRALAKDVEAAAKALPASKDARDIAAQARHSIKTLDASESKSATDLRMAIADHEAPITNLHVQINRLAKLEAPPKSSSGEASVQGKEADKIAKANTIAREQGSTRPDGTLGPAAKVSTGRTYEVHLADLKVDPHRFQYKLDTDAKGVTGALGESSKFNPDLAGVLTIWRDPADHNLYVINGHHRFELAKRTGYEGPVPVREIEAADAGEARSTGALQNIAEGQGTPVDAAKFFRETGITPEELSKRGFSLGKATARDGLALSRLDDGLFNRVVQKIMPVSRGIAIGKATEDHAEQKAVAELIDRAEAKGKHLSAEQVGELVRLTKGAGKSTQSVASLFGEEQVSHSLAIEKSEISAYIKQRIGEEKRTFATLGKDKIAKAAAEQQVGSIESAKSREISSGAAQAEEVYNNLSQRAGTVSFILDESAKKLADGENANVVKQDAYARVRAQISQALRGAEGPRDRAGEENGGAGQEPEVKPPPGGSVLFRIPQGEPDTNLFERNAKGEITDDVRRWASGAKVTVTPKGGLKLIYVNPEAAALIKWAERDFRFFEGLSMPVQNASSVIGHMLKLRKELSGAAASNAGAMADAFISGMHSTGGATVIYRDASGKVDPKAELEESFHTTQRIAGRGEIEKHVDVDALYERPEMQTALPHLQAKGYGLEDKAESVIELAAKINTGEFRHFGLSLEEAARWAYAYAQSAIDRSGDAGIDALMGFSRGLIKRGLEAARGRSDAGKGSGSSRSNLSSGEGKPERGSGRGGDQEDSRRSVPGRSEEGRTEAVIRRGHGEGLTDDELSQFVETAGKRLSVADAGEQNSLFGSPEKVYKLTNGKTGESVLVTQPQFEKLRAGASAMGQNALFGAGDLGEIVGTGNDSSIELPTQNAGPQGSLFRQGEKDETTFGLSIPIPNARALRALNSRYDAAVGKFIDEKLGIGDKYATLKKDDPQIADALHLVDNAPRYFRAKAASNLKNATAGLSPDQVRLAALMADSESRDFLREKHPDEYRAAVADRAIQKALDRFKPMQEELLKDRQALGWPVRMSMEAQEVKGEEGKRSTWSVVDREGNPVAEKLKSEDQARAFINDNAEPEEHLKRTYPEHLRQALPMETGTGPRTGAFYDRGIRPPRVDKKSREASAEYHYQKGAHDFSGYTESFVKTKEAILRDKIAREFMAKATQHKIGEAQPPMIKYGDKEYWRPDIAAKMRKSGEKNVQQYSVWDPLKGERFLIKSFEEGWSIQTSGREGIGAKDRWLGPEPVVRALETYDSSRGGQGAGKLRRWFQEQIVGFFGPMVHVNNIVRRVGQSTGVGAFDPRSWNDIAKVIASRELRERVMRGVDDATYDMLYQRGAVGEWQDIGSLNHYIGGNFNPANWVRAFGKGVLFDPQFAKGWGGLDQKARVYVADYLKEHVPGLTDQQVADAVSDGFGNYNRANWTERQKLVAKFTLFPGWDTASAKWFLKHPIITALAPALVVLAINLALHVLGKNKPEDATDLSYLHYGNRKFRTGLISDSLASHVAQPILSAAQAALQGGDKREVASAAGEGVIRGGGGLAGLLRPDVQWAMEMMSNRKFLGGTQEIFSRDDRYMPGKVLPTNRAVEKLAVFTATKAFPAVTRFLNADEEFDAATGVDSIAGVTNYKYGAEERLRMNAAKSAGYYQTLNSIGETDPAAAEAMASDPDKAAYLIFHSDLAQMSKDLKEIDAETQRVRDAKDLSFENRRTALKSLRTAREQLLSSADALNDAVFKAKRQSTSSTAAAGK